MAHREHRGLFLGTSRTLLTFFVWLGIFVSFAFAPLPAATILGTVQDSTGAAVPDTTVTVRHLYTGLTRVERSGPDGSYRLAAMPVGTCKVRAEPAGFRAEVRSSVTLTVRQEAVFQGRRFFRAASS